jgi:hypothetical protein
VSAPNLRSRHSPGKTQRRAVRGAAKITESLNGGVRHVLCLFPLPDRLHALCQCGAVRGWPGARSALFSFSDWEQRVSLYVLADCSTFGPEGADEASDRKEFRRARTSTSLVPNREDRLGGLFHFGAVRVIKSRRRRCPGLISTVDMASQGLNNPSMPRPEAARRVKSYSAATGYVYQYYFYEVEKRRRGFTQGTEYVYMVSVDRQHVFPLKIFVEHEALEKWSARTGQQLTGTEEYAVAKMRLFQAFDEIEGLTAKQPDLLVDGSNLDALLAQLDL